MNRRSLLALAAALPFAGAAREIGIRFCQHVHLPWPPRHMNVR